MLNKLAFRNMKRSARDYLVYIFTMTMVAALMYAFNSLLFQNELAEYFDTDDIMKIMIVLATIFILLIIAWLINYMVRFMLEKRSREFGIYLLLGMQKKTVSRLYIRENILLGATAFVPGIILGILFLKDGRIFHELVRGNRSRRDFLQEILDVLSLTGGELNNA